MFDAALHSDGGHHHPGSSWDAKRASSSMTGKGNVKEAEKTFRAKALRVGSPESQDMSI